jgi:hypothetical protein
MTERQESRLLAHRILDRVNADPDDDLAMLSRQLLRADERAETEGKLLTAAVHALRSYQFGNDAPGLAKEMADAIDAHIAAYGS